MKKNIEILTSTCLLLWISIGLFNCKEKDPEAPVVPICYPTTIDVTTINLDPFTNQKNTLYTLYTYTYNTNGTLSEKVSSIKYNAEPLSKQETYKYTYLNGKISRVETFQLDGTSSYNTYLYNATSGLLEKIELYFTDPANPSQGAKLIGYSALIYTGNQLTEVDDFLSDPFIPTSAIILRTKNIFTYTNTTTKNPTKVTTYFIVETTSKKQTESSFEYDSKLNYKKSLPFEDLYFLDPSAFCDNNITKKSTTNYDFISEEIASQEVRTYSYTYNTNDYPTKIIETLSGGLDDPIPTNIAYTCK